MFPKRFWVSFLYKENFIYKKEGKSQRERLQEKQLNNKISYENWRNIILHHYMTVSWHCYIIISLLLWRWCIKYGLLSKQEWNNMAVDKKVTLKFYEKWYLPVITWYKNIHWSKFFQQCTHWIKRFLQLLLLKICELILSK